jgi:RNA polymerase sigma factor (TIGR02999 family)
MSLSPTESAEIAGLLRAHEEGDRTAFDRLVPLVYDELRRLARRQRRAGPQARSLDTTALVHEAYLKLAGSPGLQLRDRGHLMAVTACAMRQVLIGRARARLRAKRGAGADPLPLDEQRLPTRGEAERLLDLDRALTGLRERDAFLAQVFECRYFAGLSEEETARALGSSLRTVQRGWLRARTWLRASLQGQAAAGADG